jgi:hypothetical protein
MSDQQPVGDDPVVDDLRCQPLSFELTSPVPPQESVIFKVSAAATHSSGRKIVGGAQFTAAKSVGRKVIWAADVRFAGEG